MSNLPCGIMSLLPHLRQGAEIEVRRVCSETRIRSKGTEIFVLRPLWCTPRKPTSRPRLFMIEFDP